MITKILTIEKLKQFFIELFLNKTDKVSDVSDESVVNAISYGVAKTGQKALKDQALVESILFPELAYGEYLDRSANLFGVPERLTASGSSTYVLLQGDSGTTYPRATTVFSGNSGVQFELLESYTIPATGYGYAKVRSTSTGEETNVSAESIINVSPEPAGHESVTNLFIATGGRDNESDEDFRIRIKSYKNLSSQQTLAYVKSVLQELNSNIIRVFKSGLDDQGKIKFVVVTQNGVDLTESELEDLAQDLSQYLNYTESDIFGENIGIVLENVAWKEVDIDFRADIVSGADFEEVRKSIQIEMSRYLDIRYWELGSSVQWDDLLQIVKDTENVSYVPDTQFNPSDDIDTSYLELPRIKGFIMRDLDGVILTSTNILLPIFYSNN